MNLTVKIFQDFFTMNLTVVKFPYKEFFLALRALQNINEVPRYLKCSVRVSEWKFLCQKFRRCAPAPKTPRGVLFGYLKGVVLGGGGGDFAVAEISKKTFCRFFHYIISKDLCAKNLKLFFWFIKYFYQPKIFFRETTKLVVYCTDRRWVYLGYNS